MTSNCKDKPIGLVVGASGGLGQAVVSRFCEAGWEVLATYRNSSPVICKGVTWIRFDGLDDNDIDALRRVVNEACGSLNAVVSLIGVPSSKQLVSETLPAEWTKVFDGNVTATVRLWQAICEKARRDHTSLVLFSSDTTASLKPNNGAYSAAKAGLEALAITLAAEEAKNGVRINILAPSLVESPLAEHILRSKGVEDIQMYYKSLPWGHALSLIDVASVAFDIATAQHWKYMSGSTVRLSARISS